MARIVWTLRARDDLQRTVEYIAADKPVAAKRFAQRLIKRVELLHQMPVMGAIVQEDPSGIYREVLYGAHRVIYRVEGDIIYIVTIHHSARLLRPEHLR